MSTNAYLTDSLTRHQIMIQRRAGGIYRDLLPLLRTMQADIVGRLQADPTANQQFRLTTLLREIDDIIEQATGEIGEQLRLELEEFAEYEAGFTTRLMQGATSAEWVVPTAEQIAAVVANVPMRLVSGQNVQNLTLTQMIQRFDAGAKRQVRAAIQAGVIEGQTLDQITRRVQQVAGSRTRAQAEAVVRTATNAIGGASREEVYRRNSSVLEGERILVTLDASTTDTCSGLESKGLVYPVGEGPKPPLHYNCRSVRIPVVADRWRLPGLEGERSSVQGPVSSRTKFDGWMRGQPAEFQKEFFYKFPNGEEKYKLFKYGDLNLGEFVDAQGAAYSIDELRRLEPMAFERAGL